jgi:phosphoribosylanthranilate isomerase
MTQIKICGITNEPDAMYAAACGADALGFIFYPSSPRYIGPAQASLIIEKLPADIARIGVFVNEAIPEVKRISELCKLDFMQLHGDESPEYCSHFAPEMLIKALELRDENDLCNAAQYRVAAILVDSRHAGLYGGTGRKANWYLAQRVKGLAPLILSGGINEENVQEAQEIVAPDALDINSGVEIRPGEKDHKKLARIFDIIRRTAVEQNERELVFKKRRR